VTDRLGPVCLLLLTLVLGSAGARSLDRVPDPIPSIVQAMDVSSGKDAHPVRRTTYADAPISLHPDREPVEWLHLMNYVPPFRERTGPIRID